MTEKIVGYEIQKGEYQGKEYNNVRLYIQSDISRNGFGIRCSYVKVKRDLLPIALDNILDCTVQFMYDRFGNVVQVNLEG